MGGLPESMNEFTRLEQFAKLQKPPAIKFADLEAKVDSRILYDILPMKVRVDFFPVTDASVLTYVSVQFDNKDLQLKTKDGVATANIHLFGEFRTKMCIRDSVHAARRGEAQELAQKYPSRFFSSMEPSWS